jgi:hemerythrin superfamily protein
MRNIDALELLTLQHDEVEALFEDIKEAPSESEKEKLFIELADKLAAHAKIEETLFYPAVMAKQTKDLLLESTEEHLAIKRVLSDLLDLDIDDDRFDAKLDVMKEQVSHHAREEEEGELFPKVKALLSTEELTALGAEMLSQFETLIAGKPRLAVPAETAVAASIE